MDTLAPFIYQLLDLPETQRTPEQITLSKRAFAKAARMQHMPTNVQILKSYRQLLAEGKISMQAWFVPLLRKRAIRSQSWIVPIQVLTKPFRCPGECIFCPNDATMPKSYINTQPGAMRALLNQFDPYKQVYNRLMSLYLTGHATDKIEMIVLGGTRDVYPQSYKTAFIKGLYDACNTFEAYLACVDVDIADNKAPRYTVDTTIPLVYPETIEETLLINETAGQRIIGLTIETRPEYVTDDNCRYRRSLGVTRIEMGVQTMDDAVLTANKRGHTTTHIIDAMHRLRQRGFKISTHLMPWLYQSTLAKDLETFQIAYSHPAMKPDEIKFYPTAVIPNTPLYDLFKSGAYKPITEEQLKQIIIDTKLHIFPPFTRIKRLARDFDSNEVVAWANTPNLRQLVMDALLKTFAHDAEQRHQQYRRLRQGLAHCDSLEQLLAHCQTPYAKKQETVISSGGLTYIDDASFETLVVGSEPDTDAVRAFVCLCTRCREMRHVQSWAENAREKQALVIARRYRTSNGEELFLSIEDHLGYVYGFTRLQLPDAGMTLDEPGLGTHTAMIRELHVYGTVQSLQIQANETPTKHAQHKGYGTQLMELAEQLAASRGYHTLSVISGIGVRGYYAKLGYALEWTYMVKQVSTPE